MFAYILYFFLSIIMEVLVLFLSLFNYKIRSNYFSSYKQLLFLSRSIKKQNKKVLLFHAASSGEFEQIKPILRGIDRNKFFIVQSFTSPSIYNIKKNTTLYDIQCYHPFDIFWLSYLFFKILNPEKYIVTRHDLWPGHILIASYFNISIYFINANIHKNSIWYHNSLRKISRYFLSKIHTIIVPSEYIYNNVCEIVSPKNITISKDTRFNQVAYKLHKTSFGVNSIFKQLYPNNLHDQIMIFGSIDSEDEKIINDLHAIVKVKKIILVPHEVDFKTIRRLENKIISTNIPYLKYTTLEKDLNHNRNIKIKTPQILLVDSIGLLASLYSLGSTAYIGGGFIKGVHSVLEPAVYGCQICCGPNIEMLDEAKLFKDIGFLNIIQNHNDLLNFINQDYSLNDYFGNHSLISESMIKLLTR